MTEILLLGCPRCGATLKVVDQKGLEGKNVTCPVCKTSTPFSKYKRIRPSNNDAPTDYPDYNGNKEKLPTQYPDGNGAAVQPKKEETEINQTGNLILGRLCLVGTDLYFQLKGQGRITVGRKANGSNAEMQIDCPNHRMSRDHLYIEVRKLPIKGYEHTVSLCKEKENPTYIGKERMVFGDKFILKDGDVISLPGLDAQHFIRLRFEIPDPEKTETT